MGKLRAQKATRSQKILISNAGLKTETWLVIEETDEKLVVESKKSGQRRTITK